VLREVIGDELRRIDDGRLSLVSVTGVEVEPDLRHAVVWLSSQSDETVRLAARHRARLQGAIGRQLRLKRTPELVFRADPAIATGERVEEILKQLPKHEDDDDD